MSTYLFVFYEKQKISHTDHIFLKKKKMEKVENKNHDPFLIRGTRF